MAELSPRPVILVVAHDAGGANALVPVLRRFESDRQVGLLIAATGPARYIFTGIKGRWISVLEGIDNGKEVKDWARLTIEKHRPDFVLAGTSMGETIDKAVVSAARQSGIPSAVVLDSWNNYWKRFTGEKGTKCYLPDHILVMDQYTKCEMIGEGFPGNTLLVTGNPYFDDLYHQRENGGFGAIGQQCRREIGIAEDRQLITFFSQPLLDLYGIDPVAPGYLGYNEYEALECLIQAVHEIAGSSNGDVTLVVKSHPKESTHKYDYLETRSPGRINVVAEASARALAAAADIVIGMSSILLVDAFLMGKPVVSLQPGLCGYDHLVLSRLGIVPVTRDVTTLVGLLKGTNEGVMPEMSDAAPIATDGKATDRVSGKIYDLMALSR